MNFLDFLIKNNDEILSSLEVHQETVRIQITGTVYAMLKKLNITVKQLAESMNISRIKLRHLLSGDCNMTLDKFSEIIWHIEKIKKEG